MRAKAETSAKHLELWFWVLGLALVLGCRPVARPDGGTGLLPPGAMAPDVAGVRLDGTQQTLHGSRGHQALVYFYPKDDTPGCTQEACALRDRFTEYEKRGIVIFGVSQDSEQSHRAFAEEHRLPFALVADTSGEVARAYGVRSTFGFHSRVSFLIGRGGVVQHVWPDVDPAVHAEQVLRVAARKAEEETVAKP